MAYPDTITITYDLACEISRTLCSASSCPGWVANDAAAARAKLEYVLHLAAVTADAERAGR